MQLVTQTCRPRKEVVSGELIEDIFAAELTPVMEGTAPEVYAKPRAFFANTYPTEGLQFLIREVFARLTGQGGNPLVRLETTFGGGKTHGLIALYHLATNPDAAPDEFFPEGMRPEGPVRVAAVVGRDFGTEGRDHDGVHVETLWGEIAWQLGGREGYERLAACDRQLVAPSTDTLAELIGDEPTLIMIDEIGSYMRRAGGVKLAGVGTLAEQVPPFLHSLAAAVSVKPRAVLVITLTASGDPYAEENERVRVALDETRKVSARQEIVVRPTKEDEVAEVVARRLFEEIDRDAAKEVAEAYHRYLEQREETGAPLPPRVVRPEYRSEIERTYPFHPELLRVLMTKTATIPGFQRTRGALRLLARVVRLVWERQPQDAWLIHPFHVDLGDEEIRMDLTARLDEERAGFQPVIEADIYSQAENAHAQEVDKDFIARDKPPLGSWVARVIFLHSLTHGEARKAEVPEIVLACAQPDLDTELVLEALRILEGGEPGKRCWYLHSDEQAFWFSKEAGLARVLDEQREQITTAQAKDEIRKRIRQIYRTAVFEPVFFPHRPADVDDTSERIKLCVMDFDVVRMLSMQPVPEGIQRIYERTGATEGFRQYKNALIFLVADENELPRAVEAARTALALQRIINSPDIMQQLSPTNQKRAREDAKQKELELRIAIARTYRHLVYPDPAQDGTDLRQKTFDIDTVTRLEQERKSGQSAQEQVIIDALVEAGKLMPADGPAPAPDLVIDFGWPHGQQAMTTKQLVEVFRSQPRLPMLLSIHRLRKTIVDGVQQERWVYFDGQRIFTKRTDQLSEADVRLDEEHELWTLVEARERGYCFRCGYKPCRCEKPPEPPVGPRPPKERVFSTKEPTAPQKAFQEMLDWAQDNGVELIEWIEIELVDCGRVGDLQQLWTGMTYLIPVNQMPERLTVEFDADMEFAAVHQRGEAAGVLRDACSVSYRGTASKFGRVYDFFHGYASGAEEISYSARLHAELVRPLAPDAGELQDLRQRLVDGEVERIMLKAKATEAGKGTQ